MCGLQHFLVHAPALEAKVVRETECVNVKGTLGVLHVPKYAPVPFWLSDCWGKTKVACTPVSGDMNVLIMPLVLRLTMLDGPTPGSHLRLWSCREARRRMDG